MAEPPGNPAPAPAPVREGLLLLGLGAGSGMVAALAANGFVAVFLWLNEVLLIAPAARDAAPAGWVIAATLGVPTIGGLLVGLLLRFSRDRRAHTPAEIIAAVQARRGDLPAREGAVSAGASLLSLGCGASVGQYGPLVHLGGSIGAWLARATGAGVTAGNVAIACAAAAAIATAFNAPIAGILFAHEVILRHFALRAFAPVAVAAVLGYVVANALLPQPPLFAIEGVAIRHLWEFAPFLVLGVASALVAVVYMRAIVGMDGVARHLPVPRTLRPACAGLLLGVVALAVPEILGTGLDTLRGTFVAGTFGPRELLLILTLKIAATALCIGMGFGGGVFGPALVIGSLFGALFGTVLAGLTDGGVSTVAVYAACGMVAVTAPVIGAPLTAVIAILELTGSYELTLAALGSVSLSNMVASWLFGGSLFDRRLSSAGLDLSHGRGRALLETRTLAPLINAHGLTVAPEATALAVRQAMTEARTGDAHLVDARGFYHGTLRLHDITASPDERPAGDLLRAMAPAVTPDTSLWRAMQIMRRFSGEAVAVVDTENRFVGVVPESDLVRTYLDVLAEVQQEEHDGR